MVRTKRQRKRIAQAQEISLTPLIDTALTLLIIFMVTTPMMQNSIKVDLPQGDAKESAGVQQELVVYIDKAAHIYFDGVSVTYERLIDAVTQKVGKAKDQTIFVRADTAVSYGKVIDVVDRLKVVGGIQYVALATEHRT